MPVYSAISLANHAGSSTLVASIVCTLHFPSIVGRNQIVSKFQAAFLETPRMVEALVKLPSGFTITESSRALIGKSLLEIVNDGRKESGLATLNWSDLLFKKVIGQQDEDLNIKFDCGEPDYTHICLQIYGRIQGELKKIPEAASRAAAILTEDGYFLHVQIIWLM